MTGARKGADLERDPRFALHGPTFHPEEGRGDGLRPRLLEALQRGRVALRQLALLSDTRLPLMSDADRQKMTTYVHLFQNGDFDAIRAMLANDVKLDLVNRL